METKRRFVLFPIQYHEVIMFFTCFVTGSNCVADLANVQEG
jgi:hypothetical protein